MRTSKESLWLIGAMFVAMSAVLVGLVALTNRSIPSTVGSDPPYAANVAMRWHRAIWRWRSARAMATCRACCT
jgi:hypothetical protein